MLLLQKQLAQYTKVISHVWDIANKAREDWEGEVSTRATQAQTSSAADTHALLAAVGMGKGLKVSYNQKKKVYLNFKRAIVWVLLLKYIYQM